MTDLRKAIVLLSGGMDSCVCVAEACERHGAENVALLHAGYGQLTQERERRAFTEIADFYGAIAFDVGGPCFHARYVRLPQP